MWGLNDFNFAELEEDCIVNGVSVPMRGLNDFNGNNKEIKTIQAGFPSPCGV